MLIEFLSLKMKTLATIRTVKFAKLPTAFGCKAEPLSSMRRIQSFIPNHELDLKEEQSRHFSSIYLVNGQNCYLSAQG